MKEINEYTDIDVSYREILKGRKVIKLEFHIKDKEHLLHMLHTERPVIY